jgi:mannose-6-phosphate isomerase-like protein (cupin superfamily)
MIYKVYPSLNDFENLSRLKVESSDFANNFDYRNIVVNKPWGYEYLWFQNEKVAIWFLRITKGQATSLHCHAKKRTSLIVLDGAVQCTTIDDKYQLKTLEAVVLEPCVFHSSMAIAEEGAFIMEIETPPMKGDLVRMHDAYGRQNSGYEQTKEYSTDFHLYEFLPFEEKDYEKWSFRNVEIILSDTRPVANERTLMIVPIKGTARSKSNKIIDVGEAYATTMSDLGADEIADEAYQFLVFNKISD